MVVGKKRLQIWRQKYKLRVQLWLKSAMSKSLCCSDRVFGRDLQNGYTKSQLRNRTLRGRILSHGISFFVFFLHLRKLDFELFWRSFKF